MTQRYVAKWGFDSRDGLTWATAYLTISKALADVTDGSGDWVNVAPGSYAEVLDLTSLSKMTLNLLYGTKVISSSVNATIELGDHCTIRGGGEVEDTSTGNPVAVMGYDNCSLLDVILTADTAAPLGAAAATDLLIQRCLLRGNTYGFYGIDVLDFTIRDTRIVVENSNWDAAACILDSTGKKVRGTIRGGSITSRVPNVDRSATGLSVWSENTDIRVVDVVIEAHCAYTGAAASNPTAAVGVFDAGKLTLDNCSLRSYADHIDTVTFDIITDEVPPLGILNLTHRTIYDSNKVSGPIVTGVVPVREWYAARADIEKVFGIRNVEIWADLDADEDVWIIQQRIEDFCEDASAEVEDMLRGASFAIPLVDSSGSLPKQFAHWVATLAGVNLYEARGVEEAEDSNNRLLVQRERVMSELEKIASGRRKTTLVRTGGVTPSAKTFTLAIKS